MRREHELDEHGHVADPLLARCVAQGKGLTWIRGTIATEAAGKLPPSTPPAFTRCMIAGVDERPCNVAPMPPTSTFRYFSKRPGCRMH